MKGPGILLIVFKGIGDVLLTTPLVRALKKNVKDCRIYFLTKRPSRGILERNPHLDGIFYREDSPALAIRRAGIDMAFDFMRSTASGFYTLASGASKRVAFNYTGGRLFYNVMPERKSLGYTVLDRLQLLEAVGVPGDGIQADLAFGPESEAKAAAFLSSAGVKPGELAVTFDITSPREHRRWPAENFARLADALAQDHGARVIFLAGPGEVGYVRSAVAAARGKHLLCPDFSLQDLAALDRRAGLHVGLSSAPMHIAVSQGTPTFTIYATQNDPLSWGPPEARHGSVQADLAALPFETVKDKLYAHLASLKGAR